MSTLYSDNKGKVHYNRWSRDSANDKYLEDERRHQQALREQSALQIKLLREQAEIAEQARRTATESEKIQSQALKAANNAEAANWERLEIEKAILLKTHPDIFEQKYPEEWDLHLKETDYHGVWRDKNYNGAWKEENTKQWRVENPELAKEEDEAFERDYPDEWDAHLKETDYHGAWRDKNYNGAWKSENYERWCNENPEQAKTEQAEAERAEAEAKIRKVAKIAKAKVKQEAKEKRERKEQIEILIRHGDLFANIGKSKWFFRGKYYRWAREHYEKAIKLGSKTAQEKIDKLPS